METSKFGARALALLLSLVASASFAADVKISALPAAGAQAGTELVPEVQGGVTVQATSNAVANSGTLTGDVTKSAGSTATTVVKVNGNTPGGACTNQVTTAISTSGIPTCTSLTSAYLPAISLTTGVSGILPVANGGTGASTFPTISLTAGVSGILPIANGGTGASTFPTISLTSGVSGILPVANGGTNNAFFTVAGPATSAKTYTFPNTSASVLTDNAAVTAAQGGTGQTSFAIGDLLSASSSSALSKIAGVATGNALISGGVATLPSWGKIGLTTHITGTLPVANGGLGITSGTSGGVLAYTATGTLASSSALAAHGVVLGGGAGAVPYALSSLGTSGQVFTSNGTGSDPSWNSGVTMGGLPAASAVASGDGIMINSVADAQVEQATVSQFAIPPSIDVQTFLANGTWAKPAGTIKAIKIELIAGGGSGAGGARLAALGAASGGGGGGAGCRRIFWLGASDIGSTAAVTAAGAVAGGAGATTNGSNGSDGAAGTNASIVVSATTLTAFAGGGGSQGAAAATNSSGGGGGGTQGAGGTASGITAGTAGSTGGATGGANGAAGANSGTPDCGASGAGGPNSGVGTNAGLGIGGSGGGGAGGGTSGAAAFAGGNAGRADGYYASITGGANTGGNGASTTGPTYSPGPGGSGGGANSAGAGGTGGNGTNCGAGGAGGGVGIGGNGGTGGSGGPACVRVSSFY